MRGEEGRGEEWGSGEGAMKKGEVAVGRREVKGVFEGEGVEARIRRRWGGVEGDLD